MRRRITRDDPQRVGHGDFDVPFGDDRQLNPEHRRRRSEERTSRQDQSICLHRLRSTGRVDLDRSNAPAFGPDGRHPALHELDAGGARLFQEECTQLLGAEPAAAPGVNDGDSVPGEIRERAADEIGVGDEIRPVRLVLEAGGGRRDVGVVADRKRVPPQTSGAKRCGLLAGGGELGNCSASALAKDSLCGSG
jgi:hypothetical protein